ncbi:type II secretion system F family protein [Patescibacteria group bacterium AH-259-L05]|nr:type II secretion system F family protein [Patescibacteria group bacterium AH-259-L05]
MKQKKKSLFEKEIAIGGVTLTHKAIFARHLSVMLKAGLTIIEALEIAKDSTTGKFKKILSQVMHSVRSGRSFTESLKDHGRVFSGLFVNAVYAGEQSGTLEKNLGNIAKQLEKERELVSKIKGAMLYPIVVLIAAFILGMVISFLILPKIIPLFEGLGTELPATTKALIWFSHFVQAHGLILFIAIIILVIALTWVIRQKWSRPVTHLLLLNTPVIGKLVKNTNLARFSRILATLIRSGINIDEAIHITKDTVGNYYYQRALDDVSKRVGKGTELSENFDEFDHLFPTLVVKMIKVGEKSGKLEEVLFYVAEFYETEVDTSVKSLSTAIEPILLIGIGLIVGFLALSIITPIYKITGGIAR